MTSQLGEAQVKLSFDGRMVSLTAANESYGSVLDLLGQHTGLAFEIPTELKNRHVPLLEIRGLSLKAALLKIMEGSGFDFLLVGRHSQPESVARLIVSGKSRKVAPTTGRSSPPSRSGRGLFGQGNQAQYATPFNPQPRPAAGVAPKQPKARPLNQQPNPNLAPQQPFPFPTNRPYGQNPGSPPQPNVQSPPGQPGQVQSGPGSRTRRGGNPNPYERR